MEPSIQERLEAYAARHSSEEPELLRRLARETHERMAMPHRLSGPLEGSFLRLLVLMLGARRVLEIGTFTGYGALWMASALPEDGELVTCEIDAEAEAIARRYFEESPHGAKINVRMGPALETLETLEYPFDLVFIDADKQNYPAYYERSVSLLRPGGLVAIDNVLWKGRVLSPSDEQSQVIHELNERARDDGRVDEVMVTIRDGVLLVRKK
jgi:caffeoyl-CoA O-methyltransferase